MPPSWSPWPQPVPQWIARSPLPWGMTRHRTAGTSHPMGGRGRHWQGGGEKQGRARQGNPWKLPCEIVPRKCSFMVGDHPTRIRIPVFGDKTQKYDTAYISMPFPHKLHIKRGLTG